MNYILIRWLLLFIYHLGGCYNLHIIAEVAMGYIEFRMLL